MSTVDNRKPWEIDLCIKIKFAASYLDIMESTGTRRQMLQGAYSQDLNKWCIARIKEILKRCENLIEGNGQPSTLALTVGS